MPAWILAAIARLAAVLTTAVLMWLADTGLEITPEITDAVSNAITATGLLIAGVLYAITRPIFSRFLHPLDTSTDRKGGPPEHPVQPIQPEINVHPDLPTRPPA